MLKLIIEDDEGRKTVVPFARDEITIGRQEGNTIRLTERNVSRRHARLVRQSGHVMIEDLGSYNGVKINGDKIAGQVQINDGDLVQIGDYDLAIQREEEKAPAGATVPMDPPTARLPIAPTSSNSGTLPALPALETAPEASQDDVEDDDGTEDTVERRAPEVDPVTGGAPKHQATAVIRIDQISQSRGARKVADIAADEAPRLVVMNTDFAGKEFPCTRTEMRIGRVEDNDIALDHRSLSRTHCKVVREESGEWRVIDLQSANGIMVNGESYAQVTLRPGDVLELGHVKLKFLAAGESYTPEPQAPSASVQVSREEEHDDTHAGGGGSKAPLIALVATVLVLVLGGGGYVFWKSQQGPDTPPKKDPVPVVKAPDPVVKPPEPTPDPVKPPPVEDPPKEDPEAAKKAAEAAVAEAKQSIAAGDFDRAELLLRGCKIGESACPEARPLLAQIEGEQGFRRALEQASDALSSGDLERARIQLEAARPTKLLKARYQELEAQRADAVKAKLAEKKPEKRPEPRPAPPPAANKTEEAKKLYEEGDQLRKEKQWTAVINRMEKCNKVDPTYAPCYRLRGTAHGFLQESELVVKYYKLYLQFAPPDDPMIPKVRNMLKTYEDSLKK